MLTVYCMDHPQCVTHNTSQCLCVCWFRQRICAGHLYEQSSPTSAFKPIEWINLMQLRSRRVIIRSPQSSNVTVADVGWDQIYNFMKKPYCDKCKLKVHYYEKCKMDLPLSLQR